MPHSDIISNALQTGLIVDDPSSGQGWDTIRPRVERMLGKSNNNVTLFIGAAASSFTPTAFPAWDKFIELIYSSQIDQATSEFGDNFEGQYSASIWNTTLIDQDIRASLKQSIADSLSWDNPKRVANYKFTETVARRLGKDYLRLLKAFETHRENDKWTVNHMHRWAAECLMDGSAAVVVTTNFDDCIEKALSNAGANVYLLTGDPHIDGAEIYRRGRNGRLILIVSGPKGCEFAENVLPQVGHSISMLYKLHGSCYMPETCIDTRLQRQQGLPAYAVDILDYLLARSVFFVSCFSGGDLNDNTDYLRMIHNRKNAQIVWLQHDDGQIEPGVAALAERLRGKGGGGEGLCFLHGKMQGQKIRWDEETSAFKQAVVDWCRELGPSWCKLVVLDLIELCDATTVQAEALEALGFTGSKQADWNRVVEEELEQPEGQRQFTVAQETSQICNILDQYLATNPETRDADSACEALNTRSRRLREWHIEAANNVSTHQPHAQAWVISALYGILLYCGNQQIAAGEALSFAQNAAFLVGDMESCENIRKLLDTLKIDPRSVTTKQEEPSPALTQGVEGSIIAFIPSLDGASGAANLYGVPRAMYVRALLHRAMLFADKIAVYPNMITNSSVFVHEILFGGREELDRFYVDFLYPVIVHDDPNVERAMLAMQLASNSRKDYISEYIGQDLMVELDDYFIAAGTQNRFLPYPITEAATKYMIWISRSVTELKPFTKAHLMERWRRIRTRVAFETPEIVRLDEELASDMVDVVLKGVALFTAHLNGPLTRSKLYHLSGLHATVIDSRKAIDDELRPDTDSAIRVELHECRVKLLDRPWISGPLCHELFDVPYRCNPLFQLTTSSAGAASLVFLEEHEEASLKFIVTLASETNPLETRDDTISVGQTDKISALLLGQASKQDIIEYREAFAPIRRMLANNTPLDPKARALLTEQLRLFKRATTDVESVDITELLELSEETRSMLRQFLKSCVFLVRKGEPLDRMYDEPEFTLPGVVRLRKI